MCSLKWKNVAEDLSFIDITELYGRVQDRDENGVPLGTSHFEISPPKTATSNRRIPLPKKAQETIAKRREYVLKRAGYADMPLNKALNLLADEFVITTRNNRFVERNSVEKTCRHIVDNCGLSSSITPHTLRHAYGSILIAKGVDIKIVSKLLGHTSVSFTYDVYINVLKSEEIKAVNKLDEIIEHEEIDTILTGKPEDIPTEYLS
jgi:integrase